MCLYLYIQNKYTQCAHIYNVNKNFILDAINRLTALIFYFIFNFCSSSNEPSILIGMYMSLYSCGGVVMHRTATNNI